MRGAFIFWLLLGAVVAQAQDLARLGEEPPVQFHGNGSLQVDWYSANGIDARQQPLTFILSGQPQLDIYGLQLPFRLFMSNHQRSVQQPFNQFGISPHYRWAKLHLGYNDLFFSPYTLANHRFRGVGLELNPGKLRVGAAYGRFRKPIAQEVINAVPDENAYLLEEPIPTFGRKAWAAKLGFGTERSFIDLILLRGEDQLESVDSISDLRVKPAENTVAGLSWSLGLGQHLTWTANAAASGFTRDLVSDSIDLEDFPAQGFLEQLLNPRESTNLTFAGDSKLAYRQGNFSLGLQYKRIDPGYQSMGAYFFQTDLEQYNLQTTFALGKGKFSFSGLLGWQRDNLYDLRSSTGKRLIGSANANWNPGSQFGLSVNYTNFGITQDPTESSTLADTLLLRQVSNNLNIVPRFSWGDAGRQSVISLVAGWFALSDLREEAELLSEATTKILHLNYLLRIRSSDWQIRAGLIYRDTETSFGGQQSKGFSLGLRKSWLDRKIRLNTDAHYFWNQQLELNQGTTLRWRLRGTYAFHQQMGWFIQLRGLRNKNNQRDFSELRAGTGLNFNF